MHELTTLVTGASSGIGHAICARLLAEGHRVIGVARDPSGAPEGTTPVALDLSELNALPGRLESITRAHPGIDHVVSNAGQGRFGALETFSYPQIRALIDLDLTSHVFVARAFLPLIKQRGGGDLLFIGSESGLRGASHGAVYCAAKFGLRGLSQSLRAECARAGVRVSLINPGLVRTPFFDALDFQPGPAPENAIAPEQVAEAVAMVLGAPPETVFDEINLGPLKRVVRKK